jgi:hypothetical protein
MATGPHDEGWSTPTLDIVIRVYNEGRNILKVLPQGHLCRQLLGKCVGFS